MRQQSVFSLAKIYPLEIVPSLLHFRKKDFSVIIGSTSRNMRGKGSEHHEEMLVIYGVVPYIIIADSDSCSR